MKSVSVRVSTVGETKPEDQKLFSEWSWAAREINCFDPEVMGYPRTVLLCAEAKGGPLLYMPLQSVLMMESLAPQPGLSPRQEALALRQISRAVEQIAQHTQHREAYFLCKDERVVKIAAAHGYEVLSGYTVLRKKIIPEDVTQRV